MRKQKSTARSDLPQDSSLGLALGHTARMQNPGLADSKVDALFPKLVVPKPSGAHDLLANLMKTKDSLARHTHRHKRNHQAFPVPLRSAILEEKVPWILI